VQWFRPSLVASQGTFAQFTAAERAFLFTKETGETHYEQFLVAGSITGTLFDLPAGEVGAVLGFERRYDSIDDTPGFNARNANLWGQTAAGRTQGSDNVTEAFGEIEIPLLADMDLFKNLTFNASARFTNYDSYGSESTYKLGLDWRLTEEYRLRATSGTSYRAPALYELFLANQTAFANQTAVDPCGFWDTSSNPLIVARCGALGLPAGYNPAVHSSALIITGGGFGVLEAEDSQAKTLGFIWTPDWLPISIAFDYFDIVVENQVAQFGSFNIVNSCFNSPTYPADPFCTLFVRDLAPGPTFGKIVSVNNSYVNLNSQNIQGLDVTFQYKQEIEWLDGTFQVDFQGTWAFDQALQFTPVPGGAPTVTDLNGDIYSNDFVGNLDARFDTGAWTFFYSSNMFSRASNNENFQDTIFGLRGLPECGAAGLNAFQQNICVEGIYKQHAEWVMTHDMSVRYREDGWTAQLGIINVFDELAPTTSTGAGTTRIGNAVAISNYDATGRRLFINLGYAF
jgi:iron complex outermembrane receptor protein